MERDVNINTPSPSNTNYRSISEQIVLQLPKLNF